MVMAVINIVYGCVVFNDLAFADISCRLLALLLLVFLFCYALV